MSRRRNGAGLFSGWWTDLKGNRIRRIYRSEWPEMYRLHRLCSEQEASAPGQGAFRRWLPAEGGYAEISFPGVPRFVERWQEEATEASHPVPLLCISPGDVASQQTPLPASAWEAA